jgi:3-oxoacyl-[acyl-carrier-protein] synthase-1
MNRSPVFISQPGVICAAGTDAEHLWISAIEGSQKGIRQVTTAGGQQFYAARIEDAALKKTKARLDMRITRIENAAVSQLSLLIEQVRQKYGPARIAVCAGTCDNGSELSVAGHRTFFAQGSFPKDYTLEEQGADYTASFISEKYGISGPSLSFTTACSSSAGAVVKGAELLRSGLADAVIAGGADVASDTVLLGFNSLEAVSHSITNPFSRNRNGITLGEGAAFFVMTREPLDGDTDHIQLLGSGESADAFHMTSPLADGSGAIRAMKAALRDSGLKPQDIDYINLHGTGTHLNDSMEAKAVDSVFGSYRIPAGTTKPLTGHTLGAAGAIELAVCYETLIHNRGRTANAIQLPVQTWDHQNDPELPELNFVCEGTIPLSGKVSV